jgi:ABC-type uncharacterized transport system fused permease/ATPase subunit
MNVLGKIFKKRAAADWTASSPHGLKGPTPREANPPDGDNLCLHRSGGEAVVRFDDVAFDRAGGGTLLDFGSVELRPGDRMMLTGPSNCGKSAALCALKESWVFGGRGRVTLPPDEQVRFVPQEDYFTDRTLRGLICAPDEPAAFPDALVRRVLNEADLGEFAADLDDETKRGEHWKSILSGGQKKKVAIAGALLHAPTTKLMILDEVTSALDPGSESGLYKKLLDAMRHGIVISIVHRMNISPLHNVFATVADGKVTYERRNEETIPKPRPSLRLPSTSSARMRWTGNRGTFPATARAISGSHRHTKPPRRL